MIDFVLPSIFAKIGFTASFLSNFFVIYLTVFHIKQVTGTYKKMVIIFAICGILFSGAEVIAHPFAHNYNKCILFFSANTYLPQTVSQVILASWAGIYLVIISLIAVQFVYRYLYLFNNKIAKMFDKTAGVIWMLYPLIPGGFYVWSFLSLCLPDDYADECMKDIVLETYGLIISEVPRFTIVPYAADSSLRWKNLTFLSTATFSIWFHYGIMLYCGLKMHYSMKVELAKFSKRNRRLQKQFFHALVVQSLGPTFMLVFPVVPILVIPLLSPYMNFEIDWHSGWLYSIVGLYPPFDSVAFMLIVSEYRKVVKSQIKYLFSNRSGPNPTSDVNTLPPSVISNNTL